jgi:ABC-type uncharacterized transport system involved in gliding motility auxiliary subunit
MPRKKQKTSARYALIGLIVSLLACVSTGLLGFVKGAEKLNLFVLENTETLNRALQISVGAIILGLALYAIMAPDTIRRFLAGRQARYGSNSLILALAMAGIIFVANYIVYNNPKSWDTTEGKQHTLANATLQALATLPEKVSAIAFYSANLSSESAESLLSDFKNNSKGKFDYRFVDPDLDPITAREYGITGDGKIMLVMGERREIASHASEQELTKTLIRLISPEARAIYFLVGHGEADLEGNSEISFFVAKSTLESKNYTVNALNLLVENKIPEDALAIVIAGPQKPLSDNEVDLLKDHVNAGGSLIVMEDPVILTSFGDSPDPLAEYLADDWGITLDDNIIIDLSSQQPLYAISASYTEHAITQNLSANYAVIMPQARSLSITKQIEDVTAAPLILTSDNSWGETNFTSAEGGQIQFDEGVDQIGPLNMAVAAENSTTKGRVVVFGNSLFASDQLFDTYGNGNMFINSVDWAAEQESLLDIVPRTPVSRTFIPPSQLQKIIIMIGVVLLLPGGVVIMGIASWISRRRRG